DVVGLELVGQLHDRGAGDRGRDHDPGRAWLRELRREVLERRRAGGSDVGELLDLRLVVVVYDAVVAVLHEPAYEAVAHAPQSDHPQLHVSLLSPCATPPARAESACPPRRFVAWLPGGSAPPPPPPPPLSPPSP